MTEEPPSTSLSDKTILVTRPAGREYNLCQLIEQAGASCFHYPVINLKALPPLTQQQLNLVHQCDMVIFISKTAVEHSSRYFSELPGNVCVVSIGSKTSHALHQQDLHVEIEAPEHNTESLLKTHEFQQPQIQNRKVLIFRGVGGRALLGDTLKSRGARVHYIETYTREITAQLPLSKQQINSLDAITISSNEGLNNFVSLNGELDKLTEIPIVLPSERSMALAKQYGFQNPVLAKNATDEVILEALINYFSNH
jgi:uroporphyrinogen-III synthase